MQDVLMLKNYKQYAKGNVYVVNPNEAHTMIDQGVAKLYDTQVPKYKDKQMKPKRGRKQWR